MMRKTLTICLVVAGSLAFSGCYGPFRLTTKLHAWNDQVSNKKFVKELVFLGMCILPAYEVCMLGDGLIFNSIEFWGGNNPIAMKDGQIEETDVMHEGQHYKVIKTRNNMTIALDNSDLKVNFRYFPEEKAWYQMDGDTKIKVVDVKKDKVFTYLPNQKTLVFDRNNIDQVEVEVMAAR